MSADPNGFMPPTPRDRDGPTLTEIIPFRSKKISIRRSKVLVPFMLVALMAVLLFSFIRAGQFMYFVDAVGALVVIIIFAAIYIYSGSRKRWWWYAVPALMTLFLLDFEFGWYVLVFRKILPGDVDPMNDPDGFLVNFASYFFAAGLCEELLKATPALLALVLALYLRRRPSIAAGASRPRRLGAWILDGLTLKGPLDGMLMGCAAGGAFILHETLGQYVTGLIKRVAEKTHDTSLAQLEGLMLLVPRVLQGVSGHMGWAAIFGYFIGLSARYPKRAFALIPLGYLVAALLHTLWDTVDHLPFGDWGSVVVSIASVLIFVACLLKAKQLELAWHGVTTTGDSILVGASPPFGTGRGTGAVGGVLSGLQGLASSLESAAGAPVRPDAAPLGRFSIGTGDDRYALEAGRAIDFGALFGVRGAPAGAAGEIDRHPTEPDVLGLKNTGEAAWVSTTPKGATVTVPRGRSLRVAAGTRIALGSLVLDIESY